MNIYTINAATVANKKAFSKMEKAFDS